MATIDLCPEVQPDFTAICSTERIHSLVALPIGACLFCNGKANAMFGIQGNLYLYKLVCEECGLDILYKEKQSELTASDRGFAIESRNQFCRNALRKIESYAFYCNSQKEEDSSIEVTIEEIKKIEE